MFLSDELQHQRYMGRKEGREEGIMSGKRENALRMIKDNELSDEKISFYTALPLEEIQNLRKSI